MAEEKPNKAVNVSGGFNFGDGSKITVHGDQVAGDKVVGDKVAGNKTVVTAGRDAVMGNQTTGLSAEDVAKLFDSLYARIGQLPTDDQPKVRKAVDTIKAAATEQAVNGKEPDADAVETAAEKLAVNAPDLLTDMADVALATLANPAAGVVTLIRKIAQKVKASRGTT